jgi:hypothetical protein
MPVRPRVHFVANHGRMRSISPTSSEWESGYWYRVGERTAVALIGGGIYFHRSQVEPSYGGGLITSYRIEQQGDFEGRYVFRYRPSPAFVGVSTGAEGWIRHKKLVL